MPKIRFLVDPKIPHDMADEWKGYVKDSEHDVSDVEADRWLRRGLAEIVETKKPAVKAEEVRLTSGAEPIKVKSEEVKPVVTETKPEIKPTTTSVSVSSTAVSIEDINISPKTGSDSVSSVGSGSDRSIPRRN